MQDIPMVQQPIPPQQPQKMTPTSIRRPRLGPGIIAGLVVLAFFALAACGTTNTATPSSAIPQTSVPSPTPTFTQTPAPPTHFKIGQTAQVGSWLLTVKGVSKNSGSEFIKPKAGNIFLVIDVSLKNTSQQQQRLESTLQFTLRDANGYRYMLIYLDTVRLTPTGTIEAGGLASGDLVYEVPSEMHRFTLAFEPDTTLPLAIWDISA